MSYTPAVRRLSGVKEGRWIPGLRDPAGTDGATRPFGVRLIIVVRGIRDVVEVGDQDIPGREVFPDVKLGGTNAAP